MYLPSYDSGIKSIALLACARIGAIQLRKCFAGFFSYSLLSTRINDSEL